jgi:hypothetical protein
MTVEDVPLPTRLVCPVCGTPVTAHHVATGRFPSPDGSGGEVTSWPEDFRCEGECWQDDSRWNRYTEAFRELWWRAYGL